MQSTLPSAVREDFSVSGIVVHGKHLGRTIDFPTANLARPEGVALPPNGVHIAAFKVHTGTYAGMVFPCVLNQGSQPTVPSGKATVEAYLLDFSGDLYGAEVTVEYMYFTRPEQKFSSLDALKAQLSKDIASAEAYFSEHPLN